MICFVIFLPNTKKIHVSYQNSHFLLDKVNLKRYNNHCDNWGEPMVLDLKGFLIGGDREIEIKTDLDFSEEEYGGEKLFPTPVSVVGKVFNKADVTSLQITCTVSVEKPCDRCGKLATHDLIVPIERVLVRELAGEEDDETYLILPDEKLDLTEFCLSEIYLALPMKHLCSEDCKGICPTCGKNLNQGSCGCETKSIDPRLEVLAKLLEQDQED